MDTNVSRRRFLRLTAAAAAGTVILAHEAGHLGRRPGSVRAADAWEAYHGGSGADHQKNFDRLSQQGYRIVSLSVYGDPADPRYAAVWVQRAGADWIAVHGVDAAGYQAFFDEQTAAGYQPVIVSATGPVAGAVFAAVFEKGIAGPFLARHGLTLAEFQSENDAAARGNKQYLRSVAIYGTDRDRRYAAVWHANTDQRKVHVHALDPGSNYQATFDTETGLPGYRPAYVALAGDGSYCSVFTDRLIGPWVARHGLTAAQYQAEFDTQKANGLRPICVQGGGAGADTRYAAIFAQRDDATEYTFTVRGAAAPALAGFDTLMRDFMRRNGIRAGQLTIAKDGNVKLAHAYTNSESGSGYRITETTDCFRLASCSKAFLAAAVQSLYDAKKLTPETRVYPLLGFSGPADARSDTITIQQLLDHTGGYDRSSAGSGFDPTYQMRTIAIDQKLGRAVTKQDVLKYMYARSLDFAPGTKTVYSNYGYLLAGVVVEHVTGQKLFDYVRNTLLKPLGITQVQRSPTALAARPSNEPFYEDGGLGQSALDPSATALIPAAYGGGQILEVADADAGLAASATALTAFIHVHRVWGNGPRPANGSAELPAGGWLARKGSMPGTLSFAFSRGDGVDWAMIFNSREWPIDWDAGSDDFAKSINALLDKTTFA
jgi:CubicO group peptidase (beta-lactamase class C family)